MNQFLEFFLECSIKIKLTVTFWQNGIYIQEKKIQFRQIDSYFIGWIFLTVFWPSTLSHNLLFVYIY